MEEKVIEQNVGSVDSYIRFLAGSAFWVNILALETGIVGGIILFVLGALMFYTADRHYCFLYKVLNISTVPSVKKAEEVEAPAHH